MSESCNCPFSDMEISDLKGLELVNLVNQCIPWINALSIKKSNASIIIEIATHLPSESECVKIIELDKKSDKFKNDFDKAFSSVRIAIDHLIVNDLYRKDQKIIKNLYAILDRQTEEGLAFWKGKLLSHLVTDLNMKSSEIWIRGHCEIMCVIKTFDFSREDFNVLLEEALSDGYLNNLSFWIDERTKVKSLFALFDVSNERIDLILDNALASGYLDDLHNWYRSENEIKNLIELFNLSEMNVFKYLKDLTHKRFLHCSELGYMTEEEIMNRLAGTADFLSECIPLEKRYFTFFDENKYQDYADEIMKIANQSMSEKVRAKLAQLATHVYSHINTRAGINIPSSSLPKEVNKSIFIVSKLADYEYIIQRTNDSWINRNIFWR